MVGKKLYGALFVVAMGIALFGCESDESKSRCPELVDYYVACYEDVIGRAPEDHEVEGWRNNCEDDHHSASCLNCALDQSCDDLIYNHEFIYDTLCADVCP